MVHAIQTLRCPKGHVLPISFDSNECGCHHGGQPCVMVICKECLKEAITNLDNEEKQKLFQLTIPLDEETLKEIKRLL